MNAYQLSTQNENGRFQSIGIFSEAKLQEKLTELGESVVTNILEMDATPNRRNIAASRKLAKRHGVNSLLADPQSNPKTDKNGKLVGILTAPLHLAPSDLSGYQVCPMASKGCREACLHTAGNPAYLKNKTRARIARTRFFFEHRVDFMTVLFADIRRHERRAQETGMACGVRLNATSDIAWESYKFMGLSIFEHFPHVMFYDYTAIPKRMDKFLRGEMPSNYYLTFSVKENNLETAEKIVAQGGTATVVFDTKRGQQLPKTFRGLPVMDGDIHDFRPDDPPGCWIGLRAKGDAIGDTSGFVYSVLPLGDETHVFKYDRQEEVFVTAEG